MKKNNSDFLIRGGIAAVIIAVILYVAINRTTQKNNSTITIEKTINSGVINCKKGNYKKGIKEIKESLSLVRRKLNLTKDKKLTQKYKDIELEAILWKGVFLLKQVQEKYSQARRDAVLNNQSFKLPEGELDEAEQAFKDVIKIRPSRAEAHRLLAYIYREKGQYLKAISELEKAIAQRVNFSEALNDLGEAYYMTKQYKRALEYYEKAVIANNKLASAHLNIGMYYFYENKESRREKDTNKAIKHLSKFIELSKKNGNREDITEAKEMLAALK